MRIAGVDPGTIQTGVGILEAASGEMKLIFSGTIQAGRNKPIWMRLQCIYEELKAIFERWNPDVVALENVFYHKDFQAAVRIGEARAVAMIAARAYEIPVAEYAPARVKQAVCGNGRASKDQIQYMVRHLLHLRSSLSADSADAVAVAICHLNASRSSTLMKEPVRV